ncbi:psbB mRNA maturation factor Mbb1 chloroplastic-like, partial [Trifolium medium]|nr:psbB mRNA maturation factor Mbb1 chloroplastic-like [Trifolium medium]
MNSIPSPPSATLFTQSKTPNHLFKFNLKVPILPFNSSPSHLTTPCCTLKDSTSVLDKNAP